MLTGTTFVTWTGQRITAVALPLVALDQTGDAWTTGLVGGFAGLPLLTSAWWGRPFRHLLTSGKALALLLLIQVAGLALVPFAAAAGEVNAVVLCVTGFVTGATGALLAPAQRSLTADLADDVGPGVGAKALAWQDMAHRSSMIFAPPLGAWLLVVWGAVPLLWCEAAAAGLAAVAIATVPRAATRSGTHAPSDTATIPASRGHATIRSVLRADRDLAIGILLAGVGGITWFAFPLGLALLGAELDRPGQIVAAAMSGYGAATVGASFLVPLVVNRVPRMPAILVSWAVLGLSFLLFPLAAPDLVAVTAVAALGGITIPFGIAALNALITERTTGDARRAAFTAETVLHNGGASAGLLVGGAIIGAFGAGAVLVATGLIQVAAVIAALPWLRRVADTAEDRTATAPATR
ncbi:MFS transporter [Myceligenerans sp. TRM 65318]|uniref:MFS transporter n=2 Tax=Myceligenerans pegani TaxID=2776917 RepID=A0ABR9MWX3_9MICO|nr:MFS transporter [Myceligenerans sp. TRM 65318]MBE3017891.1 MFS transporter [Myceligenerans sp. TRM 65318]